MARFGTPLQIRPNAPQSNHPLALECTEADLGDCARIVRSDTALSLNPALQRGFDRFSRDPATKKTHLFNGRYENIYLTGEQLPELDRLLDEAVSHAEILLGRDDLRAGCWFNHMPPGAVTTAHNHDDAHELLSAAYYVCVPEDSGELVLHRGSESVSIRPEAGMFIFFSPRLMHEVTRNNSALARLSIGINIGV